MRVLLACEYYAPSVGGVQEVMRQVAERLAARGHEVSVATTYLSERKSRSLNGVSIEEFRVSGNLVKGMAGEVERYRRYVLESPYDVFFVKAAQQWTFDALIPALRDMNRPKVFIPCGFSSLFEPEYANYYRSMPEALRAFDRLIFYAEHYRDIDFAKKHGVTGYTIVPNGADEREFLVPRDPAFRSHMGISQDAFLILTVGGLTGLKGHHELASAYSLLDLRDRPSVLLLECKTPARHSIWLCVRDWFRSAHAMHRARGSIRLVRWAIRGALIQSGLGWVLSKLGYVSDDSLTSRISEINRRGEGKRAMLVDLPREELIQAYLNSDLFAFASNVEYSPLVLYEAAAAGLPFLSVPVGNAEEIAAWTGGGRICPAATDERGYTRVDPAVLAKEIAALAAQPETLRRLGQAGRENWLKHFTWEKIIDRYESILTELAHPARIAC